MVSYFRKKPHLLILGLILIIGLFFRTYQIVERFEFAHDGDLYSWIVKDIVINHHPRLIGQLTSAEGIFIGSLFYYLLAPFFILTNMDPIGVIIPITAIGIFTIISYYWVLSKIYSKKVGLISAFLYAVLIATIGLDRWVVPTVTTSIWAIWYFFVLINIAGRNFRVLPILGILIGLIWHIHVALAPTLTAIPVAFFIAKKLPERKEILLFLIITFLSLLPLFIFEGRHNFSQTKSLVKNFTDNFGKDNNISEIRNVILGDKNDNSALNFNPTSKFILEIEPQTPVAGGQINLKITTKNPKYSTIIIYLDCGSPQKYEIGYITANFNWSTSGCSKINHKINIIARTPLDPFLQTISSKFFTVLEKENRNIQDLLVFPFTFPKPLQLFFMVIILFSPLTASYISVLPKNQVIIYYSWILGVFLFFTFSSNVVSEYYLSSINVLFVISISLILSKIYKTKYIGKYLLFILLLFFLTRSLFFFITNNNYKKGYPERKGVIQFIASDAKQKNYPCVAINYITNIGENTGFRYFLWLYDLKTTKTGQDIPLYTIVLPYELALDRVKQKFGHIGIIPPTAIPSKEIIEKSCQTPDTNLTDSMFGYVE